MLFHKKFKNKTKKIYKNNLLLVLIVFALITINLFPFVSYSSNVVIPIIPTETTRKKPIGHKIAGAEFHEYYWEKHRVITAEGEGGSGSGGGSNKSAKESREAEKRAVDESISEVLRTAADPVAAMESILEKESIEESLKKARIQQSIKDKVLGNQNGGSNSTNKGSSGSRYNDNIAPAENQSNNNSNRTKNTNNNNRNINPPETTKKQQNDAMGVYVPPETEATKKETESSINRNLTEPKISPSKEEKQTERNITPTSLYREVESNTIRETTKKQENYGGGVFVTTESKNYEETKTIQTFEEREDIEIVPKSSDDMYKSYDNSVSPTENQVEIFYDTENEHPTANEFETDIQVESENQLIVPETTEKQINNAGGVYVAPETQATYYETNDDNYEATSEVTRSQQENKKIDEEKEDETIKYEAVNNDNNDINGEDLKQEDEFIADEEIKENDNLHDGEDIIRDIEGKNKGIKIFELDRNGNPGIFDTGGSKYYIIDLLSIILTALFVFGFIFQYFFQSKHKEYNAYF